MTSNFVGISFFGDQQGEVDHSPVSLATVNEVAVKAEQEVSLRTY
jgi:hypothetical protein